MAENSKIRSLINKWRKQYKVIILDEVSMTTKRTLGISRLKFGSFIGIICLITAVTTTILTTQTGIINYLGPRPKMLLGQDYISIAAQLDSLQFLSSERERQLVHIEKLLTSRIEDKEGPAENKDREENIITERDDEESHSHGEDALLPMLCFLKPVQGEVTSEFDSSKLHFGIDLAARADSKIFAAEDGFVLFRGYSKENGNTIMIQHANGYKTWYKHNSSILVQLGQEVAKGDEIAVIGNTGENSTGPHLHFELWRDSKVIDPASRIDF